MGPDARSVTPRIPTEGRLATMPLETLLGMLGTVGATGVLGITRRKLVRRVVLEQGTIRSLISNAREDRFFEWLLTRGELTEIDEERLAALRTGLGAQPLAAGYLVALQALPAERVRPLLREHAAALLVESAGWPDATFEVRPGRADLGPEPSAEWPAATAAVHLARQRPRQGRTAALPSRVVSSFEAGAEASGELLGLAATEAALLGLLAEPAAPAQLTERLPSAGGPEIGAALELLLRAGLVRAAEAAVEEPAGTEVSEEQLAAWLAAARNEDLPALVGCAASASPAEARRAYYRTVRRFHPDRFRTGPFSSHYREIEEAFRLLHEAIGVLTDPQARARWEKKRRGPEIVPPARIARRLYEQAHAAATAGRRGEAVERLERAVQTDASDPKIEISLALLLAGNPRRREEAIERLAALVRRQPECAPALGALAICLAHAGREPEARGWLLKGVRVRPDDPLVRVASKDAAAIAAGRQDPFLSPLLSR